MHRKQWPWRDTPSGLSIPAARIALPALRTRWASRPSSAPPARRLPTWLRIGWSACSATSLRIPLCRRAPAAAVSLAGAAIGVADSAGVTRLAGLSWVSPSRGEFVMPSGIAPGSALMTLTNAGTALVVGPIQVAIAPVAPGLFPAAQIVRVHTDGKQTLESVSAGTIAMGSEPIYLRLYATGLRNRSDEKNVSCQIGGQSVPVTYAGPEPQFPGLDQVDVVLPASLHPAGPVFIEVPAATCGRDCSPGFCHGSCPTGGRG